MAALMKITCFQHLFTYLNAIIGALICLQVSATRAVGIPQPTGPYQVSVSTHTIEHFNSNDPWAPNNVSTAILATVFYPTLQKPEAVPHPYLNPETAAFYENSWNYSSGVLASITSTLQKDAPFLEGPIGKSPYPTILFGPGGGGTPVEGSTILLSGLASYGYTIIGLDHPFEQPFLRYPNGTGVFGVDIDYNDPELIEAIYETRLVDNAAFLQYFPEFVQKLKAPINTTHIGAFGYSLGGAAALGSLYDDGRLVSGLNMDGTVFGRPNSTDADVRKPVFFLASEGHQIGGEPGDVTWEVFLSQQTGYVREISINGSTHHDLCDDTFWKTIEGTDPSAGPIDGNRQVKILNTYIKAFFDFTLLGQDSPILNAPSSDWPEVAFYNVSGSA